MCLIIFRNSWSKKNRTSTGQYLRTLGKSNEGQHCWNIRLAGKLTVGSTQDVSTLIYFTKDHRFSTNAGFQLGLLYGRIYNSKFCWRIKRYSDSRLGKELLTTHQVRRKRSESSAKHWQDQRKTCSKRNGIKTFESLALILWKLSKLTKLRGYLTITASLILLKNCGVAASPTTLTWNCLTLLLLSILNI